MIPSHDPDLHDGDLHDLFDAATADLPPLPDLVPEVHRLVRRRRLATRSLGAALSAALAIGAGTFALDSPWRSGGTTVLGARAGSPEADFKTRAAALLQAAWPVPGETIRPAAGDTQAYEIIAPDTKVYPLTLRTDGTKLTGTGTLEIGHSTSTMPNNVTQVQAEIVCYRSGVMVSLFLFDTPAALISDAQLHALEPKLLAPGLIELALADGVVLPAQDGVPATAPATPSPSVSQPAAGTPPPSPSESLAPSASWSADPSSSPSPSPSQSRSVPPSATPSPSPSS